MAGMVNGMQAQQKRTKQKCKQALFCATGVKSV